MESERTQEYLEAIYKRQGKESPVSTSSLAEDLKVSQPAVTDMLKNLESRGLIKYGASKGAVLSKTGKEKAVSVVRRHRLWERFLTDILGMKWDRVHDEACKLEHAASKDVEDGLSRILGDVDTCPHGHVIPDSNGLVKIQNVQPLSEFKPLQKVCVVAVDDESTEFLKMVDKHGLRPKTLATITARHRDGSLEIEVNQKKITLSKEESSSLLARAVTGNESKPDIEEIPLCKLSRGHSGLLSSYKGGRGMLGRCLSLGFTPGSKVTMLENFNKGPLLVKIHNTEVALGRELAEKIMIDMQEPGC
jgi:DtxR family transcriptional regulator, Mn-dependent transcriptional regulator